MQCEWQKRLNPLLNTQSKHKWKQTTSFHTKEGIASIFSVVDWRPSVWTEWRPLSSGHQTTIRHKNIHKCDPLFPGWGWYLSKQSNAGTEVENFVKSWTVTPGTWDGTGDLAVCAIFPFVIFIQIGERNDNGRCGGKSCEHFNEVNVRNLRRWNRMRTRRVLLWWFLFVDQYELCDKETGNKGKSLQNHRSTCHPSGFDLLGNHSWGSVENQVDILDAEAAPCHGAKKGREIWSPGRGGDCCVGRRRTLAGWYDSSQAVDRQEEAHWMRV